MFKLCEVIEETETKIYFRGTVRRICVLAVPRTAKVGLTKVGTEANALKYSEQKLLQITPLFLSSDYDSCFPFISKLSQTNSDGPSRCKDASPTYSPWQ
jgi:hypothetical protein